MVVNKSIFFSLLRLAMGREIRHVAANVKYHLVHSLLLSSSSIIASSFFEWCDDDEMGHYNGVKYHIPYSSHNKITLLLLLNTMMDLD